MYNFNKRPGHPMIVGMSYRDWEVALRDLPGPLVSWAFDDYQITGTYPPVISDIVKRATNRRKAISSVIAPPPSSPHPFGPVEMTIQDVERRQRIAEEHGLSVFGRVSKIREIVRSVSEATGVSSSDILSPRRDKESCAARFMAMLVARECTMASFAQIGLTFDRDHSTVVSGCQRAEEIIDSDPEARRIFDHLTRKFGEIKA